MNITTKTLNGKAFYLVTTKEPLTDEQKAQFLGLVKTQYGEGNALIHFNTILSRDIDDTIFGNLFGMMKENERLRKELEEARKLQVVKTYVSQTDLKKPQDVRVVNDDLRKVEAKRWNKQRPQGRPIPHDKVWFHSKNEFSFLNPENPELRGRVFRIKPEVQEAGVINITEEDLAKAKFRMTQSGTLMIELRAKDIFKN